MLAWLQSHAPLIGLVIAFVAAAAAIPFARQKTLAMKSFRDQQDSVAARAALDVVRAAMATVVARAESEVRDLKNPAKPGLWDPTTDGPRILRDVVSDFWKLGNKSWARFRALEHLDVVSATKLLESIAEEQLLLLRAPAPAAQAPAEIALLVAQILRDPTTAPVSQRETLPSLAAAPVDLGAARVLVNSNELVAVVETRRPADPTAR